MNDIAVIIQARMGSTRLPGKIIKELYGRPLILRLVDSLKKSKYNPLIVIATSENKENDVLVKLLEENDIPYFRGSEDNVLSRFISIINEYKPGIVVRATADDPLMPADCMDELIENLRENDLDYTFAKNMPIGTSVEVIKASALASLEEKYELSDQDREHVTYYITHNTDKFRVSYMEAPERFRYPDMSFTVDTEEQFEEVSKIYEKYGDETDLTLAIEYLRAGK